MTYGLVAGYMTLKTATTGNASIELTMLPTIIGKSKIAFTYFRFSTSS